MCPARAGEAGNFDDVLLKPVDAHALREALGAAG